MVKRWWMRALAGVWHVAALRRALLTLFGAVALLLADAVRSERGAAAKLASGAVPTAQERTSLFRHQRNAYLCGVTLFLLLVLWRFQALLRELFAAEAAARSAAAAQSPPKGDGNAAAPAADELAQLRQQVAALERERAQAAALQRQAAAAEREYDRVVAENAALERENRDLLDRLTRKSGAAKKDD